jgi:hypothetical protein
MDWFKVKKAVPQPSDVTSSTPPRSKSKRDGQNPSRTETGDERIDVGYEASWSGIVQAHESDE